MRLRALTGGNLTGVTTFGTDLGLRRPDDHPERIADLKKRAGRGRSPGSMNRTTRILKEAVLMAAEAVGSEATARMAWSGF
jgi:hypothetical protein